MYSDISSNDDDLFDSSKSSSKTSQHVNSLTDDLENLLKDTSSSSIDSTIVRARLAHALYDTANGFIFTVDSYNRTVFNTLNFLTNNKFANDLYADVLEESIAKRIVVFDFISSVTTTANEKILQFLSKATSAKIDSFFFNTYISSVLEMLDFSINYNIEIYLKICSVLNRQPISAVVERKVDDLDSKIMSSSEYIAESFANIRRSLGFNF